MGIDVLEQTLNTGVVPCIKTNRPVDYLAYAQAMYDGGARVMEVTLTSYNALEAIKKISSHFGDRMAVAAGTVLNPQAVNDVIDNGGRLIVTPTMQPEVIKTAVKRGVPIYCGAFTATECQNALDAGATMIKIFPAKVGGPAYMTNLRMIIPNIKLIPSGGVSMDNAADYIRCGASAVSGARVFMDHEEIKKHGPEWITGRVSGFIERIKEARKDLPEIP